MINMTKLEEKVSTRLESPTAEVYPRNFGLFRIINVRGLELITIPGLPKIFVKAAGVFVGTVRNKVVGPKLDLAETGFKARLVDLI